MAYEPTQPHYITSDELKLILNYRLLSQQCQSVIFGLTESQANYYSTREGDKGGNVVPFRPVRNR